MAEVVHFTDWPWQHWASLQPDTIALVTDTERYTWRSFSEHVYQLAAYFARQGLQKHQAVILRGKNSVELLLSQLAIIASGARVLPLNPRLPDRLLDELLPHLNIDFVIDFDGLGTLTKDYPTLEYSNFLLFTANDDFQLMQYTEALNLPATLILTSGSTGLPKAAVHHVTAHLNSAEGVINVMNYQQQDCWLLSLPLFHVSGQGIVWRWLLRGGGLSIMARPLIEALQKVTHASLIPTQLWRLLNQDTAPDTALKEVLLGGATIPTALTDLAASRDIVCWSGYGMTEMASTVCAKRADGKKGVGIALKGKQVRIVNDEIQIQSSSQAMGYWFDGEIKPLKCTEGWFQTNDKGAFIENEYQILGRLDNVFISGGECVQPEDIEAIINSHPKVVQSFVIPIDDAEFGQRPVAVIELDDSEELNDIAAWLKDKVAPYQYPMAYYRLANELKASGIKVSRQQIKNWLLKESE
ncbi:MAG TPA: o-succinylbenzoate--CoA ligase [Providencia sp.]|uniref:o-succinylbenzoate--CoA ligase n=1 Tax=Providencia sp. TaxID=589 RepID=UPI000E7EAF60|nr:o-succinylbenzoate--CoA ligase [Providencia sp.]MBP6081347.1 o-succinylbenzoate--CoA ligase [Providencia sp.]HBO24058.1 o-succinylbenzoate--CoA ligase [Providencia sp.]